LPEILSAARRGIKLMSGPPDAGSPERIPTLHVTGAASPQQICRRGVFLVAVDMADFDGAGRAAKRADARTRRRACVRAVSEGAVGDLARFVAPPIAASRYSPESSSSESSPLARS
jgi:hypothetical protein